MISIGFYWNKVVVFAGIALALFGCGWVIRNQTSFASGQPLAMPPTDHLALSAEVRDHGLVSIAGTTVTGAVSFFKDDDELRYLILDQPNTSLTDATITVHFPRSVAQAGREAHVIIVHNQTVEATTTWLDDQTLRYRLHDIGPEASVTLIAKVPKGVIHPSVTQALFGTLRSAPQIIWLSFSLVLPLITLFILSLIFGLELRHERTSRGVPMAPTLPGHLAPAIVVALVDGHVSARAIAATLLDLARREYIDIGSHDGTFTFTKRRRLLEADTSDQLAPFEAALLQKIFSAAAQSSADDMRVRIGSSLFSRKVAEVYLGIYEIVTNQGYFTENPSIVQGTYRLAGLILFFVALAGFGLGMVYFNDPPTPLLFWIGTIVSALVVIASAPRMPVHTPAGLRERARWIGFKHYLMSTEPIDFTAQNQELYLAYLPYAVALGAEIAWTRRFTRTPFHLPDWYSAKQPVLRLEDFSNDLFPLVGYLARELAAVKEPTLS